MPETDTSTRQRLLNLWEKCPECRPDVLTWRDIEAARRSGQFAGWYLDVPISESVAFALARDAMRIFIEDWLEPEGFSLRTIKCNGSHIVLWTDSDLYSGATRTDALISAVEAVMETKE